MNTKIYNSNTLGELLEKAKKLTEELTSEVSALLSTLVAKNSPKASKSTLLNPSRSFTLVVSSLSARLPI